MEGVRGRWSWLKYERVNKLRARGRGDSTLGCSGWGLGGGLAEGVNLRALRI